MATINRVKVSGATGVMEYDIVPLSAATSDVSKSTYGVGINPKNNLEISNRPDSVIDNPVTGCEVGDKVNIVSYGSIQIKPGMKTEKKAAEIAFDNQYNTADPTEVKVHICNGAKTSSALTADDLYSNDTMAMKLNVAEIKIDSKKAFDGKDNLGNTLDGFDSNEMHVKMFVDKWNGGVPEEGTAGPIQAKLQARSFDVRCYGHGGIALQIAGEDGSGHENKIKFEASRTSEIESAATYATEGGKGLEFGTFNTQHTSLYTGDYRFKGNAEVYGVSRYPLSATSTGKIDYPTQADDFKDVIDVTKHATWNEIIGVARAYADGTISNGGSSVTDGSGTTVDMSAYATTASLQTVSNVATEALNLAKSANEDSAILAKNAFSKTKKGHLKLSSENCDVAEVSHTDESGAAVIDTAAFNANLNIESNGVVKISSDAGVEIESPMLTIDSEAKEVELDSTKISLTNSGSVVNIEAEKGVSLSITPSIYSVGTKVSTKGKLETSDLTINLAYLNNNSNNVYIVDGKVHIPYELKTFYKAGSTEASPIIYDPATDTSKTIVYADVNATTNIDVTDGYYYIKSVSDSNVWIVECETGDNNTTVFKKVKDGKPQNHGILTQVEGFENTVIESMDYVAPEGATTMAPNSISPYLTVKLADVLALVDKVAALEKRVATLEGYHSSANSGTTA